MKLWTAFILIALACVSQAQARPGSTPPAQEPRPVINDLNGILTSSGTAGALPARETAGPDTFVLFGGPDHPTEGKFQLSNGVTPDWGDGTGNPYTGAEGQWKPVDYTKLPIHWRRDGFNAENLHNNGPGNHAMWCGRPAGDSLTEGWATPPGYGNNWDETLLYVSEPMADDSVGQTVSLEFYFNYETELNYDYVYVEYQRGATWERVLEATGTNSDGLGGFPVPGARASELQTAPIEYSGGDYSVEYPGCIAIRIRFDSDGAWSDEDGSFQSYAGAVQVDDFTVSHLGGTFFEDFEGAGPYLLRTVTEPFVGDFADVYPSFSDIDPCRSNATPVAGFIDYGQIVRNGPGVNGDTTTGGTIQLGIEYGIPGNYVVNTLGGLSGGTASLYNSMWSPVIEWDLEGPGDDGPDMIGAKLALDLWTHQYLGAAVYSDYLVRFATTGGVWQDWQSRVSIWGGGTVPRWSRFEWDLSQYVPADAEQVQIAILAADYSDQFQFPPHSSPAPVFDNVAVTKYRIGGPSIQTRTVDLAQDGFPVSGALAVASPAERGSLDIPFDMARDINFSGPVNVAGDSVIADVVSTIPGATLADLRMVWALDTNALFEDALRSAPARATDENVNAGASGTVWTGEVVGSQSTTPSGAPIQNRYFFDLPDVDFLYPGDVLHYYLQATDSDGRVTTLPNDTAGFADFGPTTPFSRSFTMRGLPSLTDAGGAQPEILVINDFGRRGGEDEFTTSLRELGYLEGEHYDTYTVQAPTALVSNGIGSANRHGATVDQLAGYAHMFYLAGDLSAGLLSDGSGEETNDKGNDVFTLVQWGAVPGTRNIAYFGDNIASGLVSDSANAGIYLSAYMGVDLLGNDVRDAIGGQLTPVVTPSSYGSTWFADDFVANGGCLQINMFDQVQPLPGSEAGHYFTSAGGTPITDPAAGVASVIHATSNGVAITTPFSMMFVESMSARATGTSARTQLFADILNLFNAAPGGPPVEAPEERIVALGVFPNPFNPTTTVKFTAAIGSRGSVRVYNLRGELVRTLHSGEFQVQEFTWDGTDTRGASVASGVYVVRADTGGKKFNAKVALVK